MCVGVYVACVWYVCYMYVSDAWVCVLHCVGVYVACVCYMCVGIGIVLWVCCMGMCVACVWVCVLEG